METDRVIEGGKAEINPANVGLLITGFAEKDHVTGELLSFFRRDPLRSQGPKPVLTP
jgi:hypothetical protein